MPFLQIPIILPGDEEQKAPDKEVKARIQPQEIESFNDAYHWGALIKFKSGEIVMTRFTATEFEGILAKYWQQINQRFKEQGSSPLIIPYN